MSIYTGIYTRQKPRNKGWIWAKSRPYHVACLQENRTRMYAWYKKYFPNAIVGDHAYITYDSNTRYEFMEFWFTEDQSELAVEFTLLFG